MKEVHTGRSTRTALPSATSTWRTAAKHERAPIQIAPGHLEKEQQLENALDEYCLLREQDRSLTASRFCERYPSYRHSLRRLIDVHDAMEGQPALEDEHWPELFTEFLGYEILHELGVGAIARVYLATEAALGGRLVAIKVAQEGGYEAETLGKLTHPNIVPVFSVKHDEQTDLTAVCMPYHGSATLADLLEIGFQDGKPPTSERVILDAAREREQIADFVENADQAASIDSVLSRGSYVDGVVRLGIQMAEALAYTHEHGILHRDLKPSNVLLTPNGVPMLLDFNLASDIETGTQRLGGTLPYMPPEQIRDVHLQPFEANLEGDPRSDIFSLGVILYELLTGELAFGEPPACVAPRQAAEEFLAAQQQVPRSARELNPAVSSELAQLLDKCLALEPSERPASAADLVSELKKYFSPRRRIQRWTSRHRGIVGTVALLVMAIVSAASWHFATRPPLEIRQYNAALADIKDGRYRDAIRHLSPLINLHENCVAFRFARGVAYQRLAEHKAAEIDLILAAGSVDDPVIIECCAYSQMRTSIGESTLRVQAHKTYERLSKLARLTPECVLNWALANYDARTRLPVVISKCDTALSIRPDWCEAHYLRGLAYFNLAQQELKNGSDQPNLVLTEAIRATRLDFDRAIDLGPPSARLFTDAANAYAIVDPNQPGLRFQSSDRLKELLELAAEWGAPRLLLEPIGEMHGCSQERWFQDIILSSSNTSNTFSESSYSERFLGAPNAKLVDAHLNAYPVELTPLPR